MTARTPLTLTLEQESHQWCQSVSGTIIRVRRERGWSQTRLGAEVGLTQRQISQLETDPDYALFHVGRVYGTLRALGLQLAVVEADKGSPRRRSERRATDHK
jgi:transcriptional regulator with XRE-family HTH domain